MSGDDRDLEAFLRQFQPRQPPPLAAAPPMRDAGSRRRALVATAAAALLVATAIWHAPESPPGDASRETGDSVSADLARLVADWDTEAVDRVLLETSTVVLPDVQAPDGALRLLARP